MYQCLKHLLWAKVCVVLLAPKCKPTAAPQLCLSGGTAFHRCLWSPYLLLGKWDVQVPGSPLLKPFPGAAFAAVTLRDKVIDGFLQDKEQACLFPATKEVDFPSPVNQLWQPSPRCRDIHWDSPLSPPWRLGRVWGTEAGLALFCGTSLWPQKPTSSASEHVTVTG